MLSCNVFYDILVKKGVRFFTGIPDSLLKYFCAYVTEHTPPELHVIAANEGNAVALACGYYLATGSLGLVYMQNSGEGNAMNPLVSLADSDVYNIPVVLLIGLRGEPGQKDEPQHTKQGKLTLAFLEMLDIPYKILPQEDKDVENCINESFEMLQKINAPVALIVKKGTFERYQGKFEQETVNSAQLTREDAIKLVVDELLPQDIIISTTGKTSRELCEYREQRGEGHSRDFLTVGSMGHASQIALGIALAKSQRQVFCLDGDGAVIMHMGALAIIGSQKAENFKHIIINNGSHDSVGGQPTAGSLISFTDIAKACGYKICLKAETEVEVKSKIAVLKIAKGPALLEIKTKKGARADLGRPKASPKENKVNFMEFLSSD